MNNSIKSVCFVTFIAISGSAFADTALWQAYINEGSEFEIKFDETYAKFDDSTYTGDYRTDPLGSIMGGETYTCKYSAGNFSCTGFNQGAGAIGTWEYSNGSVKDSVISLWGREFVFDGTGRVFDEEWGLVGHFSSTIPASCP